MSRGPAGVALGPRPRRRWIRRSHWGPGPAPENPPHREPTPAQRTKFPETGFAVVAARRREAALHAHARVDLRERRLIEVNGADGRTRRELVARRATDVDHDQDEQQSDQRQGATWHLGTVEL